MRLKSSISPTTALPRDDSRLTSTDVATMLGVSVSTVNKWFRTGMLAGWLVPGSRHRRFSVATVRDFAAKHGMPIQSIQQEPHDADHRR